MQEVGVVEPAACYFPLAKGRYEVKPGLMRLGTDFGNGVADRQVFQIDDGFGKYRNCKLVARAERLSKYYQTHRLTPEVMGAVAELMVDRLVQEHPQYFEVKPSGGGQVFHSHLTQETLYLDQSWQLRQVEGSSTTPAYESILDALALQMQEDWAIVCCSSETSGETNWLGAIHLCFPNYWSAEEKIGRTFAVVHAPVAGMERINRRSEAIVHTLITQKPMVRFAWGLSTDTRLNHHPEPPVGIGVEAWQGRRFDRDNARLYLRIERQVIWGLPQHKAALFTIRTYFRDCSDIKQHPTLRIQLCSAIESMTPESLIYKGLVESKSSILDWLNQRG